MKKSTSVVSYKRTITSTQNYFEVSPLRKEKTAKAEESKEEERPVLIMKPFAAKPQISFVNVLINTEVTKFLYISNPDPANIMVEFVSVSPADRHLQLSASKLLVEAKSEAAVLLTWSPKEPGSWCDTLTVKDSKGRRGAVAVSFVSVAPKQAKGVGKGVRRGVSQTMKQVAKPAVKPHWRVPQLPKPAPREAFKPAAPEQNTWTTFDNAVKGQSTIPSTPRRETYVVQDGLRKSSENKENVVSSTAKVSTATATSSLINTSCNSPAFTMQTRSMRKKSSTPLKPAARGIAEEELEISRDSLDSSPVKPMKLKSKVLAMLETDCVFSPVVLSKQLQGTTEEDFLKDTNLDDIDFMQGNIASSDASFASRRCSTAFKQVNKKTSTETSPLLRVSPRELFNNSQERRLSTDTYVVSASNSLEGVSGESILATTAASPVPSRLSRVAEVTELNEDFSIQLQDVESQEHLQLTVLTDDHISGVEFDPFLAYAELDKAENHVRDMTTGDSHQDESPNTQEVQKSDTFEIPALSMQQEMSQNSTQKNARETFDIVPPPKHQTKYTEVEYVHETYEINLQVEENISEVFQNVHATFDISAPHNKEMPPVAKMQGVVDVNNHTTFNVSPPKKYEEKPQKPQNISEKSTPFLLQYSPPKPFRLPQVEWAASPEPEGTKNATYTKTKDCSTQDKTYDVPSVTAGVFVPIGLTKPLVLETKEVEITEEQNISGERLHDPDLFLYEYATMYATAPGIKKDPFYMNPMIHDAWLEKCDVEFKQWLNAVLTPPEELDAVEVTKVDAANLWARSTKAGANQELAPSREKVSSRYLAVKSRLDHLRRAALNLFRQPEIAEVLCKMTSRVDSGNIKMRQDKQLHLDQGLKQSMLELILSYNPLWLRLGLETVMGRVIPIQSNSDIHGLSHFIINRLLSVEAVLGKSHLVLKAEFREKFNRFVLKKFLLLVFFLDQAKTRRLIRHNPCLFRRQSKTKTSKDMLLTLSRLLLAGEGDITKHLSYMGYTVSHKQGYLDEFYYSVTQLGVDLRDGVRLTRVVELVTGSSGLSNKLRVPPVSRLQKIHNVEVALKALENAGYAVQNVKAVDIVAGHKEKTLSMLWQIVHNFQAPRIDKAARVIQSWWLRPSLKTQIKRKIYKKQREHAVITFQKFTRGYLCRKYFEELKLAAKIEKHHNAMACIIQKNWRIFLMTKRLHVLANWNKTNSACIKIQRKVRIFLAKKQLATLKIQAQIKETARKEAAAVKIQALWRCVTAKKTLEQLKQEQKVRQLAAAVKIQSFIRRVAAKKVLLSLRYEAKRTSAAVVLQSYWRQYLARQILHNLKQCWEIHRQASATQIQCAWRAHVARRTLQYLRIERENQRQSAALVIQCLWRSFVAKKILTQLQTEHKKKQETAALKIQCAYRCFLARKELKQLKQTYETRKQAATSIQCAWRCFVARKVLSQLKQENEEKRNCAALKIQCSWRCFSAKQTLQQLKFQYALERKSAITIQCAWRQFAAKKVLSQLQIENEEKRNCAALIIQCLWRCFVAEQTLKQLKLNYELERKSANIIQSAWRCFQAKKILTQLQAENEEKRNCAALKVQCLWRCYVAKQTFLHLRAEHEAKIKAATILQCAWRCFEAKTELAELKKQNEDKKNCAALKIQCLWRCFYAKETLNQLKINFERRRQAATTMQCAWRCFQAKKIFVELQKQDEQKKNYSALKIQCFWKCYVARQTLMHLKLKYELEMKSATVIQCAWRKLSAKRTLSKLRVENDEKRNCAALRIQCLWRSFVAKQTLIELKQNFETCTKAATSIQCAWRCFVARKVLSQLQQEYEEKRNCAALKIQCSWRCFLAKQTLQQLKFQYASERKSAITIQCAWRQFAAKKVLSQLQIENEEKKNCAALIIQCLWRSYFAKQTLKKLQVNFEIKNKSATIIQRIWRCFEAKKKLSQLKKDNEEKRCGAALKIQCLWRSFQAKQTLQHLQLENEIKKSTAALRIQCAWRCVQAKKVLSQLQAENKEKRNSAALKIQCLWRSFQAKQTLKHLQLENETKRNAAALRIQCSWRCFEAKKVLIKLQEEHEVKRNNAALNIQCLWRCFVARQILHELKNDFLLKNTAAITIQCGWKQHLAIKTLLQLKKNKEVKENCAALNIQCWWRSLVARKILAHLQKEHQQRILKATVKIQSIWRMCCAKKVLVQLKEQAIHRQQSAAMIIQNVWKIYVAKKLLSQLKLEFETKKSIQLQEGKQQLAASIIQRAFRRWLWKQAVQYLMDEKQKDSKYINQDILQAWEENLYTPGVFSSNVALSIWYQQKHMQKQVIYSATIIQAAWRGFVCRRNNHRAAQAGKSVLIQAVEGEKPIIIPAKLVTKVVEKQQRIQEAAKNANVENRIAYKIELALSQLGKTMGHDVYAMSIFDNYLSVTETCVPLILPALPYMANLLKTNNRSVPAMEAALPATGALLSLAKHPNSQPYVWEEFEELIPDLIYTLTISKDSNEKVFNNACTVLWMMARNPLLRDEILKQDKIAYRLKNLITHIQGRQRTTRQSARQPPPPMPSLRYNKNPRCFSARMHGLQSFMKLLGLPIPKSK